jgi:SAM-dependent methyltransferase
VILHLGCGSKPTTDQPAVNVDIRPLRNVDVVHDLNELPWPWKDEEFDKVDCTDILEHLDDVVTAVDEVWRVLEPGGLLWIRGPHQFGRNWLADPTHKRAFNEFSFDYLDPNLPTGQSLDYLTERKFRLVQAERDGDDVVFLLRKMLPEDYQEPEHDWREE